MSLDGDSAKAGCLCGINIISLIEVLLSDQGFRKREQLIGAGKAFRAKSGGDPAEARAINTLRALVYAARTDGRLGIREKLSITGEIRNIGLSKKKYLCALRFLFEDIDPERIARNLTHPDEALWLYALSYSIIRTASIMGRGYLEQLAQALHIPDSDRSGVERGCDRPGKQFTKDLN